MNRFEDFFLPVWVALIIFAALYLVPFFIHAGWISGGKI